MKPKQKKTLVETKTNVLVDTSAWIYLFAKSQGGPQAEIFKNWFKNSTYTLHITDLIIEETHKWLCHHGHSLELCSEILERFVDETFAEILPLLKEDRREASRIVYKYRDHRLSYTDACSVVIMKRMNLEYICSADRHFDLFPGVSRLPK
jgi:predicted nucleic acid-binding protein